MCRETLSVWAETVTLWDETLVRTAADRVLILEDKVPAASLCVANHAGSEAGSCVLVGRHDNTFAAVVGSHLHGHTSVFTDNIRNTDNSARPLQLDRTCTFVVAGLEGFCWSVGWHGNLRKWAVGPDARLTLQSTLAPNSGSFCAVLSATEQTFLVGSWGGFEERCCEVTHFYLLFVFFPISAHFCDFFGCLVVLLLFPLLSSLSPPSSSLFVSVKSHAPIHSVHSAHIADVFEFGILALHEG